MRLKSSTLSRALLSCAAAMIAVAALGLVLTACGSSGPSSNSSSSSSASSGSPNATASGPAGLLPANIKSSGVLHVGSYLAFPPMEFYPTNGNTPIGLDVDLMNGIGRTLGLTIQWTNMNWDGLRPALQTGRFDCICAAMADFTDRQKQVTFVDYMQVGMSLLVLNKNATGITTPDDLAGKTIAVQKGTFGQTDIGRLNAKFKAQGLKEMVVQIFPTEASGVLAVQTGRVFGVIEDAPSVAYLAKTAGGGHTFTAVLPGVMPGFPYGIAVNKSATDLANAIKGALNEMISNGSYGQILSKWESSTTAIKQATINGGTMSSGA